MERLGRRRLLAAGATAATAGLAGCTDSNALRYRIDSPEAFVDDDPRDPEWLPVLDVDPEAVFQGLLVGEPTEVADPAVNRPHRIFIHNDADEHRDIDVTVRHDWLFGDALVVRGAVSFPPGGVFVVTLTAPATYDVSVSTPPTVDANAVERLRIERDSFDCRRQVTGVTVGADWVIESRRETDDATC